MGYKSWTILFLCLLLYTKADIIEAMTLEQAEEVIQDNIRNITGILFVDSTRVDATLEHVNGQDEGTVNNLLTSIRGMFSSKGKTIYQFAQEVSDQLTVLEIDTNNKELSPIKEMFNVTTVPYLVLLYCNDILFKDVPSRANSNEIYDIIYTFGPNSQVERYCAGHLIERQPRTQAVAGQSVEAEASETSVASLSEVRIEEGQLEFKPTVRDDPYYFGDNEVEYDNKWYKDPMNGGLISKSSRIPLVERVIVEQPVIQVIEPAEPYERLSLIDEVTYYEDFDETQKVMSEPPPVKIEIEEAPIIEPVAPTEIHDIELQITPTDEHEVHLETIPTEIHDVQMEVDEKDCGEFTYPYARKIKLDKIKSVKVAQKEKPTTVDTIELVYDEEPVTEIIEVIEQPIIEVIEQPIIEIIEQPPIYVERRYEGRSPQRIKYEQGNKEKIVYHEISNPKTETWNKTEYQSRVKTIPRKVVTPPPLPKTSTADVKKQWKKVLSDEEVIMNRINGLLEEDKLLSEKIKEEELKILNSEEKYKKAKSDIQRQIKEAEDKMLEYEKRLADLYNARDLALKAREELYKPCSKCTVDSDSSVVEKKLKTPYNKSTRKTLPSDQSNFHDLYESALHQRPSPTSKPKQISKSKPKPKS